MKNSRTLSIIISISFIFTAFFGAVHFYCFNEKFYENEHNSIMLYGKHINDHIGITNEQLKELTSFTLKFLNDPEASLDIQMEVNGQVREIYTDDEKIHMDDVRTLNITANYLLILNAIVLIVFLFIYIYKKHSYYNLFIQYKKILCNFLLFFGLIAIWIVIDFDSFWTLFHKIFFAGNELWLLDLRKDILIMIVPPEFFNHLVIRILVLFISLICIMYYILYKLSRKKITND